MSTSNPKPQSRIAALEPKYARLLAVLKSSAQSVEYGGKATRADVVDLQRRAIKALQECADIALSLAECLGDGVCPRDITCLHLGDWNRCDACFNAQVSQFFDQASKFMNAIVANAEPGPLVPQERRVDQRPTPATLSASASSPSQTPSSGCSNSW